MSSQNTTSVFGYSRDELEEMILILTLSGMDVKAYLRALVSRHTGESYKPESYGDASRESGCDEEIESGLDVTYSWEELYEEMLNMQTDTTLVQLERNAATTSRRDQKQTATKSSSRTSNVDKEDNDSSQA